MAGEGKLIIRSRAGVKKAELVGDATGAALGGWWTLACQQRVNEVGLLTWSMHGQSSAISLLEDFGQIEYWRRDRGASVSWYREFLGLYRDTEQEHDPEVFHGTAVSALDILNWRHVSYLTGRSNRSSFGGMAAETLMKRIVEYNLTSSGSVADGRLREATAAGLVNGFTITLADDAAQGNIIPGHDCSQANVLETLQKLALVAGGDFDLIKVGDSTFEFHFYAGQRGEDRTNQVTFSTTYDNMRQPRKRLIKRTEKTVAIIGGKGQEALRTFVIRTGDTYNALNDIETALSYTNTSDTAVLGAFGDQKLAALKARAVVDFEVRQAGKLYARDYFLGDLVTSQFAGTTTTHKVQGVGISYEQDGQESIDVELVTL